MKTSSDTKYMKAALEAAWLSKQAGEWPGGAVVVKHGEVVAITQNRVQRENDPTAHAEIEAIRITFRKLAGLDLVDLEMYTTAEPCPMCFTACVWANIKKIHYGVSLKQLMEKGDYQINLPATEINKLSFRKIELSGGILEDECKKLFD
jgi:tRNA(adenine34) deaminase